MVRCSNRDGGEGVNDEHKKPQTITIRVQPGERDAWQKAAGDVPVSRWIRRIVNEHLGVKR